jgi:uncharacterized protein (TIGR00297 family)
MSGLVPAEALRKLIHVAMSGFAFLLRDLSWPQAAAMAAAAVLFNWQVLPRLGGRRLWRPGEHQRGFARGILLYPLSVLGLVLLFRDELWMAAAVWAVLAWGDGMASLLGLALGGPRLPWSASKTWTGLLSFLAFGTLGAAVLTVWTLRLPASALLSGHVAGLAFVTALVAALVESMPTALDDNLTVPLAGALTLLLAAPAQPTALLADPGLPARLVLGVAINGAIALLARRVGSIDGAGAASATAIGALITAALGLPGLAVMVAFFVVGSLATRLGYAVKAARGIAQEKGGARGWRNAWANGGVPAALAVLAALVAPHLRDLYVLGYAAAVATAAADTCSSEVGKAYGRRTFVLLTLRPAAPGTEGAVSLEGTLGGAAGALLVALVGQAGGLYGLLGSLLVAAAGVFGSLVEGLIGAVAERRSWLDNDQLNALNTLIGGGAAMLAGPFLP